MARAAHLIDRDMREAADALRQARLRSGLSLEVVAAAVGVSASGILRRERAVPPGPRPVELAKHAAAVGLRARIRVYIGDSPLRDAPQVELLRAFRERLHPDLRVELERPVVGSPGIDRRAFDMVIRFATTRGGVEAYTRFHDCQAQIRECLLKQRDAGIERLYVVVKGTEHNRRAVATARDLLTATLPLGTRQVLRALAEGRDPGQSGLVLL